MCKSGQFYPNLTWVIPLWPARMNVKRVASIWKGMMNPTNIDVGDISNVFFDTISGVANMRYFNAQQLVVDRREEEQEIDCALRDDCNLTWSPHNKSYIRRFEALVALKKTCLLEWQRTLEQWSGRFLGIIGWDPSVCKSNRLQVDILRFSFITLG